MRGMNTTILSGWGPNYQSGKSLAFENCKGGYFSNIDEYALKIQGGYKGVKIKAMGKNAADIQYVTAERIFNGNIITTNETNGTTVKQDGNKIIVTQTKIDMSSEIKSRGAGSGVIYIYLDGLCELYRQGYTKLSFDVEITNDLFEGTEWNTGQPLRIQACRNFSTTLFYEIKNKNKINITLPDPGAFTKDRDNTLGIFLVGKSLIISNLQLEKDIWTDYTPHYSNYIILPDLRYQKIYYPHSGMINGKVNQGLIQYLAAYPDITNVVQIPLEKQTETGRLSFDPYSVINNMSATTLVRNNNQWEEIVND